VDKQDPGFGPAYITINVRPTGRVLDTKLHTAPINTRLRPTSELIDATKGSVSHKIETDGEANICVRASSASIANPMRFSLRVIEVTSDPKYDAKGEELHVDEHLSHVEVELNIIKAGMTHILMNADQAKNRDGLFHKVRRVLLCSMLSESGFAIYVTHPQHGDPCNASVASARHARRDGILACSACHCLASDSLCTGQSHCSLL
jgi:hypothetical protein